MPRVAGGYIVARRPSGIGIHHLFRRAGEWSLCGEAVWLQVERAELVNALTWICAECQQAAGAEADPGRPAGCGGEEAARVAAVRCGACPTCAGALTDPRRSPGGWRHCRACRRGWAVETIAGGAVVTWQDWPVAVDAAPATAGGLAP